MDTGINENVVPDSLILHDPITGEPIQKQYDESSIVLDPLTEKQIADQEHMIERQRLMAQQQAAGLNNEASYMSVDMDKASEKKSRTLCFISLGGLLFSHFAPYIYAVSFRSMSLSWLLGMPVLMVVSWIAGFILMIVARVRTPKYGFAKFVMWAYIVLILLRVIGFGLLYFLFMLI